LRNSSLAKVNNDLAYYDFKNITTRLVVFISYFNSLC